MKRIKLPLLYVLSFISSVAPALIYFGINHERYIATRGESVRLLFGGVLLVAILVIKALGYLKIKSTLVFFGLAFLLSFLLESIISDLLIFSLMALIGELLATVVRFFIKREKDKTGAQKTAEILKETVFDLSGRV